ncbi:TetR/AcrR family transcriptional regulator [Actinoallomurus vinaceus]|uniref:TetR/AcrR family transcriptional regulator n=1 Tax=Actinoallomurus vinaceus TaxID=1080074 RepID=A0ABP8UDN3_9ACTN
MSAPRRVGRPRAVATPPSGLTPREEVLAAAAELFTGQGYAATTTREVAERAGIRQASIYHYFKGKEEILASLLESTVRPSLEAARALMDAPAPAEARLWALCVRDVRLLCSGPHNLGVLYLLPEAERFARFQELRDALKDAYAGLLARTAVASTLTEDELALRARLIFSLVEGVILIRRDASALPVEQVAEATADAALRVGGVPDDDLPHLRELGRPLL